MSEGSASESHWIDSSLREKVIEHLFVGELLRLLWCRGRRDIEVLRAEVDRGGYDLVLECNGVLRHVQLKASHKDATAQKVSVNVALAAKTGGCVIWIRFDPATMALGPFLWFGGRPHESMPDLGEHVGRHTRAGSSGVRGLRQGIRDLRQARFVRLESIAAVAAALFGV